MDIEYNQFESTGKSFWGRKSCENDEIDLKTILSHQKPSKHTSPVWIFDIDFQFFHIKLLTIWALISHEFSHQRPKAGSQILDLIQCDASYFQNSKSKSQWCFSIEIQ